MNDESKRVEREDTVTQLLDQLNDGQESVVEDCRAALKKAGVA